MVQEVVQTSSVSPFESLIIQKFINKSQTVVDVCGDDTGWTDAVLAHCAPKQILFYATDRAPAIESIDGNVVVRYIGSPNSLRLDDDLAANGIAHVHFLHIGANENVHDVLAGAERALHHSRIDFIQFHLDPVNSVADRLLANLKQKNYLLFSGKGDRIVPYVSAQAGKEAVLVTAIHERICAWHFTKQGLDVAGACKTFGVRPKGIIHVGAHEGQEFDLYRQMGFSKVLFVEANPAVFERLQSRISDAPGVRLINRAVLDKEGPVTFHVTNFDQSSSILALARHLEHYPTISETKVIEVEGTTLDCLLGENAEDYNVLALDIQGAELLALKGAAKTMSSIEAIIIEVQFDELYHGAAQIEDIDSYLEEIGFRRVATSSASHQSWGDAFYVRNEFLRVEQKPANQELSTNTSKVTMDILRVRVAQLQAAADAYEQVAQIYERMGDTWLAQFGHVAAAEIDLANLSLASGFSGPLNGQYLRTRIVETILEECGVQDVVETGTFRGTTTEYFAQKIKGKVYTCETQPRYWLYSNRRLANFENVELHLLDSRAFLSEVFSREATADRTMLCYLDAHWGDDLPLATEIDIILSKHSASILLIDDFEVPGDCSYSFDDYGPGKKLCLELVAPFRNRFKGVFFPSVSGLADSGLRRGYALFTSSEQLSQKLAAVPGLRAATAADWDLYGL